MPRFKIHKIHENVGDFLHLKMENQMIAMKIDKTSCESVMNHEQYFSMFLNSLRETKIKSINVDGLHVMIIGQTNVLVEYYGKVYNLKLFIAHADFDFTPRVGTSWLNTLAENCETKIDSKATNLVENSLIKRPKGFATETLTCQFDYKAIECSSVRGSQNWEEYDLSSLFLLDEINNLTSESSNEHDNLTTNDAENLHQNCTFLDEVDSNNFYFIDNVPEKSEQNFFINNLFEHKTFLCTLFLLLTINVVVLCLLGVMIQNALLNMYKLLREMTTSIAKLSLYCPCMASWIGHLS